MPRSIVAPCALWIALVPAAGALAGDNLLANGEFDDGLHGWSVEFPQVHLSGADAGFAPDSGSMQIDHPASAAPGVAFTGRQCVAVAGGGAYEAAVLTALLGPDHPRGAVFLELAWYAEPGCAGEPIEASRLAESDLRYWFWVLLTGEASAPEPARSARVTLGLEKLESGDWTLQSLFDNARFAASGVSAAGGDCVPAADALCLRDRRFRVTATWATGDGASGAGTAVPLSDDSGYFWFFDDANVEAVVKVLDGCGVNDRYWVYAGGLTDLGVTLLVEDTRTGATAHYGNALGRPFETITDTAALDACP